MPFLLCNAYANPNNFILCEVQRNIPTKKLLNVFNASIERTPKHQQDLHPATAFYLCIYLVHTQSNYYHLFGFNVNERTMMGSGHEKETNPSQDSDGAI